MQLMRPSLSLHNILSVRIGYGEFYRHIVTTNPFFNQFTPATIKKRHATRKTRSCMAFLFDAFLPQTAIGFVFYRFILVGICSGKSYGMNTGLG